MFAEREGGNALVQVTGCPDAPADATPWPQDVLFHREWSLNLHATGLCWPRLEVQVGRGDDAAA